MLHNKMKVSRLATFILAYEYFMALHGGTGMEGTDSVQRNRWIKCTGTSFLCRRRCCKYVLCMFPSHRLIVLHCVCPGRGCGVCCEGGDKRPGHTILPSRVSKDVASPIYLTNEFLDIISGSSSTTSSPFCQNRMLRSWTE